MENQNENWKQGYSGTILAIKKWLEDTSGIKFKVSLLIEPEDGRAGPIYFGEHEPFKAVSIIKNFDTTEML